MFNFKQTKTSNDALDYVFSEEDYLSVDEDSVSPTEKAKKIFSEDNKYFSIEIQNNERTNRFN